MPRVSVTGSGDGHAHGQHVGESARTLVVDQCGHPQVDLAHPVGGPGDRAAQREAMDERRFGDGEFLGDHAAQGVPDDDDRAGALAAHPSGDGGC